MWENMDSREFIEKPFPCLSQVTCKPCKQYLMNLEFSLTKKATLQLTSAKLFPANYRVPQMTEQKHLKIMKYIENRTHVCERTCIIKRVGHNTVSVHTNTKTSVNARFPTVSFCRSVQSPVLNALDSILAHVIWETTHFF